VVPGASPGKMAEGHSARSAPKVAGVEMPGPVRFAEICARQRDRSGNAHNSSMCVGSIAFQLGFRTGSKLPTAKWKGREAEPRPAGNLEK
jgi:hypothetical protein